MALVSISANRLRQMAIDIDCERFTQNDYSYEIDAMEYLNRMADYIEELETELDAARLASELE